MIVVLFGQPCSGKTTLAKELKAYNVDGDKLRTIFTNKDYSKEGRIKNLNRASDIAHYLNQSIDDGRIVLIPVDTIDGRPTYNVLFNDEDGFESMYAEEVLVGLTEGKWNYDEDATITRKKK